MCISVVFIALGNGVLWGLPCRERELGHSGSPVPIHCLTGAPRHSAPQRDDHTLTIPSEWLQPCTVLYCTVQYGTVLN